MKEAWKKMTRLLEDHLKYMWLRVNDKLTELKVYKIIMHFDKYDKTIIKTSK